MTHKESSRFKVLGWYSKFNYYIEPDVDLTTKCSECESK